MGHQVTPNCITNDLIVLDTNDQGWTAMMVPVNISGRKIHGKLQIRVDSLSDLSDLKKILHDQPQATCRGMYSIEVSIYVADEDTLATFDRTWGLDVVPSVLRVTGSGDVKIEWRC